MSIINISSFEVENFKSIKDSTELNFNNLNIFIGKNDAGKSSLLEALKIFLKRNKPDNKHFYKHRESEILFKAIIDKIPKELIKHLNEEYQSSSNRLIIERKFEFRKGTTPKAVTLVNGKKLSKGAIIKEEEELSKIKSRNYIWSFMPTPIYIPAERKVDEQTKLKGGTLLNDILLPILKQGGINNKSDLAKAKKVLEESLKDTSSVIGDQLTKNVKSHMPDVEEININPGSLELKKAISPQIHIKDKYIKRNIEVCERGSGIGSLLILSLMQVYVDMQIGEGYCLLFEEPGNCLHPGAERKMLGALKNISNEGGQLFITTHSQVFIDQQDYSNMYIVKRIEGESQFREVDQDAFEAIEEIGARNSDLLQSDFVIYVEGPSDVQVVEEIARNSINNWNKYNIVIQSLGGMGNIKHCDPEKMSKINQNFVFLLDSDKTSSESEINEEAINLKNKCDEIGVKCKILERRTIENYFSSEAINEVFDLNVSTDFVGKYNDVPDDIKIKIANERIQDPNIDKGNYNKVKHGKQIAKTMYENNQNIKEIEIFLKECIKNMNS